MLKNAAKVLAIANAHIDAAYKPGSLENMRARSIVVDVLTANIAKGRVYEAPNVERQKTVKAAEKDTDRDR